MMTAHPEEERPSDEIQDIQRRVDDPLWDGALKSDVRYLLARVKELERERDKLREAMVTHWGRLDDAILDLLRSLPDPPLAVPTDTATQEDATP